MHIRKKDLEDIDISENMKHGSFVFNYGGKYRSDLKLCQKADASVDVMDKANSLFKKAEEKK